MHPRGNRAVKRKCLHRLKRKQCSLFPLSLSLCLHPFLYISFSFPPLLPCTVAGIILAAGTRRVQPGMSSDSCLRFSLCLFRFLPSLSLAYSISLLFSLLSTCQTGLAKRAWAWACVCARAARSLCLFALNVSRRTKKIICSLETSQKEEI